MDVSMFYVGGCEQGFWLHLEAQKAAAIVGKAGFCSGFQ